MWLTRTEAAARLHISTSTVSRRIKNGDLAVRREGRRVFVAVPAEQGDSPLRPSSVEPVTVTRGTTVSLGQRDGSVRILSAIRDHLHRGTTEALSSARRARTTAWILGGLLLLISSVLWVQAGRREREYSSHILALRSALAAETATAESLREAVADKDRVIRALRDAVRWKEASTVSFEPVDGGYDGSRASTANPAALFRSGGEQPPQGIRGNADELPQADESVVFP